MASIVSLICVVIVCRVFGAQHNSFHLQLLTRGWERLLTDRLSGLRVRFNVGMWCNNSKMFDSQRRSGTLQSAINRLGAVWLVK